MRRLDLVSGRCLEMLIGQVPGTTLEHVDTNMAKLYRVPLASWLICMYTYHLYTYWILSSYHYMITVFEIVRRRHKMQSHLPKQAGCMKLYSGQLNGDSPKHCHQLVIFQQLQHWWKHKCPVSTMPLTSKQAINNGQKKTKKNSKTDWWMLPRLDKDLYP